MPSNVATDDTRLQSMQMAAGNLLNLILWGKWGSKIACAGAELGVFDHLASDTARSAEVVAAEIAADPRLLYRLLRALATLGLLVETADHRFSLTDQGMMLRTDTPGSMRDLALLEGGPEHWAIWQHVASMVREGWQNAFLREFGALAFDYAGANPAGYGANFAGAMSGGSAVHSGLALEALAGYDFTKFSTWCDVAGGHGHTMSSFLHAYPHLSGIVLDLPDVVSETDQLWAPKMGVEQRCRYVAGDMFEDVPEADIHSLKMILHDWSDADCLRILSNIRRRAKDDGRILIIEYLVPGPATPHFSNLLDIQMMCWGDGRERTPEEYAGLLKASGWQFIATHYPGNGLIGVVEAVAV